MGVLSLLESLSLTRKRLASGVHWWYFTNDGGFCLCDSGFDMVGIKHDDEEDGEEDNVIDKALWKNCASFQVLSEALFTGKVARMPNMLEELNLWLWWWLGVDVEEEEGVEGRCLGSVSSKDSGGG